MLLVPPHNMRHIFYNWILYIRKGYTCQIDYKTQYYDELYVCSAYTPQQLNLGQGISMQGGFYCYILVYIYTIYIGI